MCSAIFNPAKWSSVWNDRLSPPCLLVAHDRVSGTTDGTKTSNRACKALAKCILAWSFLPLPHLPFCESLLCEFFAKSLVCNPRVQYLIENLSRHFFRLFTTRFDVFRAYSIAVARLTFFSRLLIAACTSFLRTPESHLSCPRSLVFSIFCSFHLCNDLTLHCHLSLSSSCNLLWNSPKTLAIPLRDVTVSPFSFIVLRMSVFFLADLIYDMFLIPLNFSKICCIASFLFCSCFVPDALLDPLAHLLQLLLVFSRDGPSFFDESLISSSLLSVLLPRLPVAPSFVHPSA